MVLKIVNSIISHHLSHNVHLIYALLYQEDMFKPLQSHPRISGLVFNIEKVILEFPKLRNSKVIDYFRISLEKEHYETWSIDKVHEAIKRYSMMWKHDSLKVKKLKIGDVSNLEKKFVHLQFKYEEEENAEDFFSPYVWAIVVNSSGFYWNPENIRLFSTNPST